MDDDVDVVCGLSLELGYACERSQMLNHIERLSRTRERIALVAEVNGLIVGWVDAYIEMHLQSDDAVVIGGLIVGDGSRGTGVGSKLCRSIEAWAAQMGVRTVRVRSQIKRTDAHGFYLRLGYSHAKTSLVFEKQINDVSNLR